MTLRLIFIRHGLSSFNKEGRIQGSTPEITKDEKETVELESEAETIEEEKEVASNEPDDKPEPQEDTKEEESDSETTEESDVPTEESGEQETVQSEEGTEVDTDDGAITDVAKVETKLNKNLKVIAKQIAKITKETTQNLSKEDLFFKSNSLDS